MPNRGKHVALSDLKDTVKEILLELKTANFLEISTQDLEKTLHKNGIFYTRSTIGKLLTRLGIPVFRKGRDTRFYDLKNWSGVCVHYWLVESPNGPSARGKCQKCGEERSFSNAPQNFGWTDPPNFGRKEMPWISRLDRGGVNENDFSESGK